MSGPPLARRARIIAAAIGLLDTGGVAALNMRALAADLNVRPMTLYYYVPNKAMLLALIVTDTASHIRWSYDHESPRDQLIAHASEVYRTYAAITWMPDVLRAGTQAGARPCVVADPFLTTATAMGFAEERASGLWRACWFLISSQLQTRDDPEVGAHSPGSAAPEDADLTVYITALIDGMIAATPEVKAPTVSGVRAG